MKNDKVILQDDKGNETAFEFEHALAILRDQDKAIFKPIGKHEFIDNELIIRASTKDSTESTKQGSSKKGRKARKPSKNTDPSV